METQEIKKELKRITMYCRLSHLDKSLQTKEINFEKESQRGYIQANDYRQYAHPIYGIFDREPSRHSMRNLKKNLLEKVREELGKEEKDKWLNSPYWKQKFQRREEKIAKEKQEREEREKRYEKEKEDIRNLWKTKYKPMIQWLKKVEKIGKLKFSDFLYDYTYPERVWHIDKNKYDYLEKIYLENKDKKEEKKINTVIVRKKLTALGVIIPKWLKVNATIPIDDNQEKWLISKGIR